WSVPPNRDPSFAASDGPTPALPGADRLVSLAVAQSPCFLRRVAVRVGAHDAVIEGVRSVLAAHAVEAFSDPEHRPGCPGGLRVVVGDDLKGARTFPPLALVEPGLRQAVADLSDARMIRRGPDGLLQDRTGGRLLA